MPGNKAVFVKNTDYVPRKEPPSLASGGKVAKVDRVEWLYIPDSATAAAALNAGEADWWEQPPADLVPVFAANKDIVVDDRRPARQSSACCASTMLQPPFNNPKMREAVLYLVDQKDYMGAVAGDEKYWKTCAALFTLRHAVRDQCRRRVLLEGANLRQGQAADQGSRLQGREDRAAVGDRPADRARPGAGDPGSAAQGRAQRRVAGQRLGHADHPARLEGADRQGRLEHLPHLASAPDMLSPAVNIPSAATATRRGSAGRPTRRSRSCATPGSRRPTSAAQKKLADEIQVEAYANDVPYVPTGQFVVPTAYRKNLDGIIIAPVTFLWNVEKK